MIPLRDVIPSRSTPYATIAIIGLTAAVWLGEILLPPGRVAVLINDFGVVPAEFDTLTLITSPFLHGGWLHVLSNMWCLWIFGETVEGRMGHVRFAAFYLLSATAVTLAHVSIDQASVVPIVGAGGGVAGVLGAYFVSYPQSRVLTLLPLVVWYDIAEIPAVLLLGVWLVVQVGGGGVGAIAVTASTVGGIAVLGAHLAGLVVGGVALFGFRKRRSAAEYWHAAAQERDRI